MKWTFFSLKGGEESVTDSSVVWGGMHNTFRRRRWHGAARDVLEY